MSQLAEKPVNHGQPHGPIRTDSGWETTTTVGTHWETGGPEESGDIPLIRTSSGSTVMFQNALC